MPNISFCRICLSENGSMNKISNTILQNVYEKLTIIKVQLSERELLVVCQFCYSQLRKCHQLMMRAQKAEEILQEIFTRGVKVIDKHISGIDRHKNNLVHNLSVETVWHMAIEPAESTSDMTAKGEISKANRNGVFKTEDSAQVKQYDEFKKEEPETNVSEQNCKEDADTNDAPSLSDLEDDLPLNIVRKNKGFKEKRQMRGNVRKKRGDWKVDALEIILTKEEQLQEVLARAKTSNYLHSPLKCEFCYRGFLDANAYENHMEKHDERSGAHECDVCRMRYQTSRHLRMHATSAHERRYRCNRCTHTSHTRNQAKEHDRWHSGHTFECKLCSKRFGKSTSYLTHLRKCHPTEYVCDACGKSCIGRHGLCMHRSKMHRGIDECPASDEPSSDHFCKECNVQFLSADAWKRHILTAVKHLRQNESNTQCKICDERFPSGSTLARHMREHERSLRRARAVPPPAVKLAEFTCEQCGCKFVKLSQVRAHVKRVHLGVKYDRNIVCELCGKRCVSNASLRYHQRTHTGERPCPCDVCGKRFADNNQLRIHTRTHTGERPYCCAQCGKRFSQRPALNRHFRIHTGVKPYECSFCSKTFSQSNSMKLHVRTVHLKQMPARKANKTNTAAEA